MWRLASIAGGILAGLVLSGCSTSMSGLLGGDEPSPQQQMSAQSAPDLSMPPDLQLHPPGAQPPPPAAPSTQVASVQEPDYSDASVSQAPGRAPAPAPQGDVYERNGISKVHADGTPKSDAELKAELKQVYLAKKQQANPRYGTVFNIGNIFKDE